MSKKIGSIVGGSLSEGLSMRVEGETPLESIKTGKFVSIIGKNYTFFSLITDLSLEVTHPEIIQFPPSADQTLLLSFLKRKNMYAIAQLKPMVMVDKHNAISPVKTLPEHFSVVMEAKKQDVSLIFGDEHDASKKYFNIGKPVDMDTPVCIDLEKLTERSTGIFGKTGTGKTFLTRLVLAGLIHSQKSGRLS